MPSSANPPESVLDEITPLLAASGAGPTSQANEESQPLLHPNRNSNGPTNAEDEDVPLPKAQIALLCYTRIVEPIAFFSIFPFLNEMVQVTGGLEEADVGFYAGLIESLFSLTQMLLMIPWGRAADYYGRKPILVFSLSGVAVATALFGFSTELWHMILFRCLGGIFAGTIVTVRTMISENSTPKTQARAFSWFAFSSNLGIFLGPFIGGILSNPAKEYPRVFGNIQLFKDFPYALPTLVTGAIGASAAVISALFIKETLTPDRRLSNKASPPMSTYSLLKHPGVAPVIYIYGHVMLLAFAYTAVFPIFQFTSPALGGFGFTNFQISLFIALAGISQSLWTLIGFPPLQHRFGTGGLLRACVMAWPIMFSFLPLSNSLLRKHWMVPFWITAVTGNMVGSGVSMAFTCVQLALNDIAPSHSTLGTLNGIALALSAGLRAFAPATFASIFAAGVKTQILSGYLVWVVLIALALGLMVAMRWLPAKAEGRLKTVDENND
ncbi:MFS transporter [Bisporella sp. PMI_857]|nr:MFS transporter [Bisporella sp. PMI_857]